MPSWKRVIVSGSDAALNSLLVSNGATITGSFNVTGSANINGQLSASSGHFATRAQIGELGTEQTSVKINGLTFNSNLKVSDLSNSNAAQTILHKHSTTVAPIVVGARSNSDTTSHGAVVNDMPSISIYGAGWTSGTYSLNGQINIGTDDTGTISGTSSPGKIEFWTTPNGTIWPEIAMKIDSNKKLTVSGSVQAISFTGSLLGTASYATQALSASFATTASYVNPLIQNVQLTGSLNVTNGNSIVDLANGSILGKVGNVDYFKVTGSSSTGGVVQIAHTNTTVVGQLTGNSGGAGNGLNLGFYNYLNLRTLNSSITITADVAPSWRVYSGTNFSFLGYSGFGDPNGGEVIMKDALTGNEAFHAYLGANQRIIMSSSSLAINQTTPGAKLDIRTGGSLSTDLGLRVRNNANTADLFSVAGNGVATLSGSLNVTQGITGSLQGTSSYATQALSSSYALSASHATSTAAVAGTTNYVSKFTSGTTIGNSQVFDNGTNVGIGTTTPGSKLQIGSLDSSDQLLRLGISYDLSRSLRGGINWHDGANTTGQISTEYDGAMVSMVFGSLYNSGYNSNNLMIIRGNGNVGIGTASPSAKLNVSGDIHLGDYGTSSARNLDFRTANSLFTITTDGTSGALGTTMAYSWASGGQGPLKFNNAAGEVMRLAANGNVGIGTTTPSASLHVYKGLAGTTPEDRTTPLDVLVLESENTNQLEYAGFGQSITFRGSTYNDTTQRTLSKITHQINDDSVNTTRGSSLNFQLATGSMGNTLTSRMYIDYTGNVGIGTTTFNFPASNRTNLAINGSVSSLMEWQAGGTTYGYGIASSSDFNLGSNTAIPIIFSPNQTERMRITSGGNVGIGITSPTSPLHIIKSGGARINLGDSQNTVAISSIEEVGDSAIGFYTQTTTERMRITSAGNVGIGTTSPPSKLSVLPSNDDGIALTDGSNNVRGLFFINNAGGTYSTGLRTANYWLDLDASGAGQNAIRMFTGTGGIGTGTERMRITSAGNVGIGTTNPEVILDVLGSGTVQSRIQSTSGGDIRFSVDNVGRFGTYSASDLLILTTGSERMRITSGGNVGIGTTTPNAKLDVSGSAIITGSLVVTAGITGSLQGTSSYATQALSSSFATTAITASFLNGGTNGFIQNGNSFGTTATLGTNDNNSLQFETNNSTRMFISSSGDVGIGTTSPNAKLYISASGALSSDIAFRIRNSANTGDLLSVGGTGTSTVTTLVATSGVSIQQPAGNYYPTISFYNNGGSLQGNITGYNSKLLTTNVLVQSGYSLGVGFEPFDSIYARSQVLASSALSTDNSFAVVNNPKTGYHLKVTNAGNVQTGVGGLSIPRTDTPNASLVSNITYTTGGVTRFSTAIETPGGLYGSTTTDTSILALSLGYYGIGLRCYGGSTNTGFTFNTIVATTGTYFMRMQNGATDLFTILTGGSIGISNSAPKYKLDVSGSARISGETNTSISSSLVVYGSGSAQPVFTVQGSQGELFSVTDSLSGSLFSVNDISGLPIMEVFSDNTTLMGSYQAPSLNTTVKTTTAVGNNVIYSVPTASYNGAWFEYVATSASNARAGQIMSVCSSNTITYTETTTTDIGTTTGLNFMVMITGSNFALTGSSTTAGWTIKTIVRSI
jgi:hypothetical protein